MRTSFFALALAVCWLPARGQNEWYDFTDNDVDGLTDCADPDCADHACHSGYIPCNEDGVFSGYLMSQDKDDTHYKFSDWHATNHWHTDYTMPAMILVGGKWHRNIEYNAIGYNNQNGLIYGINNAEFQNSSGTVLWHRFSLIQSWANTSPGYGTVQVPVANGGDLQLPTPSIDGYNTGACDFNGHLYVMSGEVDTLIRIHLNSLPDYDVIQLDHVPHILDFAFIPNAGPYMFGVSGERVVRIDIATGAVTTYAITSGSMLPNDPDTPFDPSIPGGIFADADGNLFCHYNWPGEIWEISPNAPDFTDWTAIGLVDTSSVDSLRACDAASCPLCNRSFVCEEREERSTHPSTEHPTAPDPTSVGTALLQNRPNPFDSETIIGYSVEDAKASSAAIVIYDMNGVELSRRSVAVVKNGQLSIQAGSLAPGIYRYALVVDGQRVDSKQMVLLGK